MSYAQAAGSGAKSYGVFYTEKLLVCHAGDHLYEKVAEALHNCGYWDHVSVSKSGPQQEICRRIRKE